jgi:hypothetical protein
MYFCSFLLLLALHSATVIDVEPHTETGVGASSGTVQRDMFRIGRSKRRHDLCSRLLCKPQR